MFFNKAFQKNYFLILFKHTVYFSTVSRKNIFSFFSVKDYYFKEKAHSLNRSFRMEIMKYVYTVTKHLGSRTFDDFFRDCLFMLENAWVSNVGFGLCDIKNVRPFFEHHNLILWKFVYLSILFIDLKRI